MPLFGKDVFPYDPGRGLYTCPAGELLPWRTRNVAGRRFRLRRLEKANVEALLVASGQNVKRLLAFSEKRPRRSALARYPRHRAAPYDPIPHRYELFQRADKLSVVPR